MANLSLEFEPTDRNIFRFRNGPANSGQPAPCQWKLCITATDEEYLVNLLYNLSKRKDCFFVKYSPSGSPKCRDGMFLGRVFLSDPEAVVALWSELRTDKKLMCSIQDDNAVRPH